MKFKNSKKIVTNLLLGVSFSSLTLGSLATLSRAGGKPPRVVSDPVSIIRKPVRIIEDAFSNIGNASKVEGNPAYLHDDSTSYNRKNWMSGISDRTPLDRISMVGTHDSASFYGGDMVQTQSLSLTNQLTMGVRALDIRCRHFKNGLSIHHGTVYQHKNLSDVVREVAEFLKQNPSETVLMRLGQSGTFPEDNTNTFEEAFLEVYREFGSRYSGLFWTPKSDSLPLLGDVRGKIVILQNFESSVPYGWSHESASIQDEYSVSTNWDLYSKWESIKLHLNSAAASRGGNGLFINYLSASGGSFPYFIASGKSSPQTGAPQLMTGLTTPGWKNSYPDFPRVNCFIGICSIAFEGTNKLAAQSLSSKGKGAYVGILMADFPGPGLVDAVIHLNDL